MTNIHSVKERLAQRVITRLGESVWLNGVELQAVIQDDEYEDEIGYRRELTASFERQYEKTVLQNDTLIYKNHVYKINRMQTQNDLDNLFIVELKRA